jgi:hypothetical protein
MAMVCLQSLLVDPLSGTNLLLLVHQKLRVIACTKPALALQQHSPLGSYAPDLQTAHTAAVCWPCRQQLLATHMRLVLSLRAPHSSCSRCSSSQARTAFVLCLSHGCL